ncbi:hypothetical protein V5H98_07255 [Georgenia sp. M64]|uniref:hypothetical protein n=1 Tax=Georgenia sp. M64 TaxID=3120520 RepID=UPI0030E15DA8
MTLRYNGRLHHIGVGRTHARTPVVIVIQDRHIVIAAKDTGEIIRKLTLDPTRDYQPRTTTKAEPSK